jgi:succinyl-diaminopimelate desuccinylase
MTATLALTKALIAKPSVTPDDQGCQPLLIERLQRIGFHCETLSVNGVTNLWAIRPGSASAPKCLAFAGHTDVVPPGPHEAWRFDPFTPTEQDGKLYGRGAADMKTSIASFVVACEEFVAAHSQHPHSLALLITSDEEGPSTDGTLKVVEMLEARGQRLDYCLVGEPTSEKMLGDTIKNGRRGSLSGKLTLHGIQGHIAYPHLAKNPIHIAGPIIAELASTEWDHGNAYFQPTSWQASNVQAGTGANNVIPGTLTLDFNFRFSTESTVASLQQRVHAVLDRHGCQYDVQWTTGGLPFLTPHGELSSALTQAIQKETGVTAKLSTTGGTSDGRFIARICQQVVEFGPPNASIHKIDEHIELACIEPLKNIYRRVLEQLVAL